MEDFNVSLSRNDIDLILVCLGSCAGQCFLFGNTSLALDYCELHNRIQALIR